MNPESEPKDRAVTIKEATHILGRSRSSIYAALSSNPILADNDLPRPFPMGARSVRFSEVALQNYLRLKAGK